MTNPSQVHIAADSGTGFVPDPGVGSAPVAPRPQSNMFAVVNWYDWGLLKSNTPLVWPTSIWPSRLGVWFFFL